LPWKDIVYSTLNCLSRARFPSMLSERSDAETRECRINWQNNSTARTSRTRSRSRRRRNEMKKRRRKSTPMWKDKLRKVPLSSCSHALRTTRVFAALRHWWKFHEGLGIIRARMPLKTFRNNSFEARVWKEVDCVLPFELQRQLEGIHSPSSSPNQIDPLGLETQFYFTINLFSLPRRSNVLGPNGRPMTFISLASLSLFSENESECEMIFSCCFNF
jgi:hypothetical protein